MKSRQDFATVEQWEEYYKWYAAAMVMNGILSNHWITENAINAAFKRGIAISDDARELIESYTILSVGCADAIITQLKNSPKHKTTNNTLCK
jgi:hypothetical protein